MSFKKQMSGLFHGSNAEAGLYTLMLGMIAGNITPSVSDAIFFRVEQSLRDKWKRGELTAEQFWKKNTISYYLIPCTYWIFITLLVVNVRGSYHDKLKWAVALVGSGVALGVIMKLMQNDKKQLIKEDEERDLLREKYPEVVDILSHPEFENIAGQLIHSPNKEKTSGINGERKYVKLFAEREAEKLTGLNQLDL